MVRIHPFLSAGLAACSLAAVAAALWFASSEGGPPPRAVWSRCEPSAEEGAAGLQRGAVLTESAPPDGAVRAAPPSHAQPDAAALPVADGGALAGRVVDGDRMPIAGARVRLVPRSGPLLREPPERLDALVGVCETGPDGGFAWPLLPAGAYSVEALATGRQRCAGERRAVAAGERTQLAPLVLGPATCLHGRVFTPTGAPAGGASVEVRCISVPASAARATTATDGSFTLDHLAPGPFVLQVCARGCAPLRLRDVDAGRDLVLQLSDGARVRGVVRGAAEGADLRVQLRRIDDAPQSAVARARADLLAQIGSRLAAHGGELATPATLHELAALERQRRALEVAHRPFGPAPDPGTGIGDGGAFAFDGLDDGVVVIEVVGRRGLVARSAPVLVSAAADAVVDVALP